MSTKVYTGVQLIAPTFDELDRRVKEVQTQLQGLGKLILKQKANESIPRLQQMLELYEKAHRSGYLTSQWDMDFSLTVFPYNGNFYGIYFTQSTELANFFKGREWVKDFHYQNQTDQPEDVSDQEWAVRSHVWDTVLGVTSVPSQEGYSIDLVKTIPLHWELADELRQKIPC